MTDLEQKARRAMHFTTIDGILDLTWRDLGEDSDGLVFGILHPKQYLPQKVTPDAEYDLSIEQITLAKAMWRDKWRRIIQEG